MTRLGFAALALLSGTPVLAQSNGAPPAANPPYAAQPPPQGYAPAPAPSYAPPAPSYAPPPQGYAPAQPPGTQPAQPPRYPEAQSVSPSTAGTGSQQVVVNPPTQTAPPPPPTAPNVTVNPPASSSAYAQSQPVVVEQRVGRSPLETVAVDAGYGALAGALVGAGIALIDQGNNWGRDLTLGAGGGILVGAVVGGIEAYGQTSHVAMDGLGSPDRDRMAAVPERSTVVSLVAGRF